MSAPVRHTCPTIDRIIAEIKGIIHQIEEEYPNEAHALEGIVSRRGEMEDIRSANDALRNWGYNTEAKVDSLENELSTAYDTISDLQDQIRNME